MPVASSRSPLAAVARPQPKRSSDRRALPSHKRSATSPMKRRRLCPVSFFAAPTISSSYSAWAPSMAFSCYKTSGLKPKFPILQHFREEHFLVTFLLPLALLLHLPIHRRL